MTIIYDDDYLWLILYCD